jgi:hypothetical protein
MLFDRELSPLKNMKDVSKHQLRENGEGVVMFRSDRLLYTAVIVSFWLVAATPVGAESITGNYFGNTWARTDQPVATHQVNRTWMWGPSADSPSLLEPYAESPTGQREVQYFDKTRMEITHPDGDTSSTWYVTNGLLAQELITGRLQLGDNTFEQHDPAQVNVAGDANDPNGPTYATFNALMGFGAIPNGWKITQTVDRAGTVGDDTNLASYNVIADDVGAPTNHNVASVFWDFMNSSGTMFDNGSYSTAKLFDNPFYATGYPLTEAYWTNVLVGGTNKQVLVQVFERRVLTYTPSNSDGWKVEAGNVGQHYYTWRYTQLGKTPTPDPNPPAAWSPPAPSQPSNGNNGDQNTGNGDTGSGEDKNCSDFATHQEAQQYFESHGGSASNNVDGLDSNHDGIACESLP